MNPFDVAVIAIVVVSALFAFVRGFLKEALSVVVWIGAAVATYYAYPVVLPMAFRITSEVWLAEAATIACTFIVVLILLALISSTISARVHGTPLGQVDRILGLLYGAVRGAVIACLLYIGITTVVAESDQPKWFTGAQSLPALARGAALLETILPASARAAAAETIDAGRRAADNSAVPGSRPILPQAAPVVTAPPVPMPAAAPPASMPAAATPAAATPAGSTPTGSPTGSTIAGQATASSSPGMSESDRLMRPPPPATPAVPEKPNYRTDDRKAMDRAFQSVQ